MTPETQPLAVQRRRNINRSATLRPGTSRFLFLTTGQWFISIAVAIGTAAACFPFYQEHSLWIGSGLGLGAIALCHMALSSRHVFPLPQMAILYGVIAYVIAPWLSLYFPAEDSLYSIKRPDKYFPYATSAITFAAIGWILSFRGLGPINWNESVDQKYHSNLTHQFDGLLILGLLGALVINLVPESLRFVAHLVANLRFIAIYGWVLLGARGWMTRVGFVLVAEVYIATSTGFFLAFILWSANLLILICCRTNISRPKLVAILMFGIALLPCVQHAKWQLRNATWSASGSQKMEVFGTEYEASKIVRPFLLVGKIAESGVSMAIYGPDDEFLRESLVRYNQGWIVDRIMWYVPSHRRFAEGETLKAAVFAAAVPRILFPDKARAGGRENFERYTGLRLNKSTSMNLGFVGEMYANYGVIGGAIGSGVYAFLFGSVFRWLLQRSQKAPLMIALIPYILNWAILSEIGIVEVLNYCAKASMITVGLVFVMPLLFRAKRQPVATDEACFPGSFNGSPL